MKAHQLIGRSGFDIEIFWDNRIQTVELLEAEWLNNEYVWVVADVRLGKRRLTVSFETDDEISVVRSKEDAKVKEAEEYVEWFKSGLPTWDYVPKGGTRKLIESYEILLEAKK